MAAFFATLLAGLKTIPALAGLVPVVWEILKLILKKDGVPKEFFNTVHEAVKSHDPKKLQSVIRDL